MKTTIERIFETLSKEKVELATHKVNLGSVNEIKQEINKVNKAISKVSNSLEELKKITKLIDKKANEQRNENANGENVVDKAKEVSFEFARKAKELGVDVKSIKEYNDLGEKIGLLINEIESGYKFLKSN